MKHHLIKAALGALIAISSAMAAGSAPASDLGDASVIADPAHRSVMVDGPIGPKFESHVQAMLREHPQTRWLVLRSPGGMRGPALRVAQLANRRGITVRIAGRCSSACALLWAAARSREMTTDSRVGLHRSSLDATLPITEGMRQQLMARNDRETDDVLRRAGFPEAVIAQGSATPPTTMSWFGAVELQHGGVPFVLLDAAGIASASSGGGSIALETSAPH
ncbi:hypothetical protein [Lysobacter humi (ex Lee et al. 2017)]